MYLYMYLDDIEIFNSILIFIWLHIESFKIKFYEGDSKKFESFIS